MARPPRVARWLAGRLVPPDLGEYVLGDLDEQYAHRSSTGPLRARIWYWRQVRGLVWHLTGRARREHARPQGDSTMGTLMHETRYVLRALVRQPAYVLAAVLSLSLAIAANGLVYGMVDGIVLNPFQLPEPDRLVSVGSTFPKIDSDEGFIEQHSTHEIEDVRAASSLVDVASFDIGNRAISNGSTAIRALTALLIDDPLPALGRPAMLGRGFTKAELGPGGPDVVIISHRTWTSLFGRDPDIVGKTVRVNSVPRLVVGVTDERTTLLGTEIWIPWGGNPLNNPRNRRQFTVVARLAPGVDLATANAELAAIAGRTTATFGSQFPEYEGWRLRAVPWAEAVTGQARGPANILIGAGIVVLLIASANLTSLMLVRLSARRREIAVRYALGADAWQVTRLLLIESTLLAVFACGAGLGLASAALGPTVALLPTRVIGLGFAPSINLRVVAYCALFALVAALMTALLPAWQARRGHPQRSLREGETGGGRQRLRQTLVVAELALAIVLLVGAGQMLVSFSRVQNTDPGFNMHHVATMRLTLAYERYGQGTTATDFFARLVERMTALPGVTAAAAASQFPPEAVFTQRFRVVGDDSPPAELSTTYATLVTPGAFDVLDLSLVAGRRLDETDRAGAPMAVVVNEAFARRFLGGKSQGRLLIGSNPERADAADVVGIVADARNNSMMRPAQPEIFATIAQAGAGNNQFFLLARTTGDPMAIVPSIRQALSEMDPDQPLYVIQSMEDAVDGSLFAQRVALMLVGVFAIGSLAIAGIGVFGVIAYWVATRAREIGIRMALGASTRQVARLIVGQTLRLLVIASVFGLVGGVVLARITGSLLYESPTVDPSGVLAVVGILVTVGLIASYVPSRRASRVDPVHVLRSE